MERIRSVQGFPEAHQPFHLLISQHLMCLDAHGIVYLGIDDTPLALPHDLLCLSHSITHGKKDPGIGRDETSDEPLYKLLCLPTHHEDKRTVLLCLHTMGQVGCEHCCVAVVKGETSCPRG